MKYLFLAIFLLLVAASVLTAWYLPDERVDKPILYWVTDRNPARDEQVRLFHEWMQARGYPDCILRLDTTNSDQTKKIILGVSGVGSDIMDLASGHGLRLFHSMGLLHDVTDSAHTMGFATAHTYEALEPELTVTDDQGIKRQYLFPCNTYAPMLLVNRQTLRAWGQPVPPSSWTIGEFETLGRQFVSAANPPGQPRRFFYADWIDPRVLRRGLGITEFNETQTRCTLDNPANVQVLARLYQWTYVDRILPSVADRAAITANSGYGGDEAQLLNEGKYAMIWGGRHFLIPFRQFDKDRVSRGEPLSDLAVVEPPHGGFPNTLIGARAAAVYAGTKHPELAIYFLAYLASAEYNMQIVRDADSLSPNPRYTKLDEYRRPSHHPNEWDVHGPLADACDTIAIAGSHSPFILPSAASRIDLAQREAFMADQCTAEQAAQRMAEEINAEIRRTLDENPALRPRYEKLLARQAKIDDARAAGRKIPLEWIEDPFHRRYYLAQGWVE